MTGVVSNEERKGEEKKIREGLFSEASFCFEGDSELKGIIISSDSFAGKSPCCPENHEDLGPLF